MEGWGLQASGWEGGCGGLGVGGLGGGGWEEG